MLKIPAVIAEIQALLALGHEVKPMPGQFVKPFLKGQ
jgi:hypothetical protein